MDTGVKVVGSGQVNGAPDVLRVSLGVEHAAPDVASAVARVGERTDAVMAALRGQGIEESQLATSAVNVYEDYKHPDSSGGYRASHTITVETTDLTGFGELLNAAVDAAGNSLTVHGLQFDIQDKTELLIQARELAFQQAREKAGQLAALAGFSLGSVTAIAETYTHAPIVAMDASAKGASLGFSITPGDHAVSLSLEVHFAWA